METRDIVVIGASAGGLEPLRRIVADLSPELPAAVFVVLHLPEGRPSQLPEILDRAGPLPCAAALDGEEIAPGRVYVARPGHHLMLEDGVVRLTQGPRENRHRPSVDALFRSAARVHGPRVIGVVLSGALDDGTAGLIAVKIRGGLAIVQDPAEAFSADMPRNAMRYLEVDEVLPTESIGPELNRRTREEVDGEGAEPPALTMIQETRIARLDPEELEGDNGPGAPSFFACPECHGGLREIQEGNLLRFRCRTGHAYSPETLLANQDEDIETALFIALRSIEERLSLRRRLLEQARARRLTRLADEWESRASELEKAARILTVLLQKKRPVAIPAP